MDNCGFNEVFSTSIECVELFNNDSYVVLNVLWYIILKIYTLYIFIIRTCVRIIETSLDHGWNNRSSIMNYICIHLKLNINLFMQTKYG